MRASTCASAMTVALLLVSGPARAEDESVPDPELFDFGLGLIGSVGMVRLGPPSTTAIEPADPDGTSGTYPGFTGPALGGGLFVEGRFFGYVGLEVGVQYGRETLNGQVEQGSETTKLTLHHPVLRIPILLKGVLPLGTWSPFVIAGPEVARYGLSETRATPEDRVRAVASALPSLWWTIGAGAEWRTPVERIDLRVPLGLRFSFNPNVTDDVDDRVQALGSGALLFEDAAPQFRLTVSAGAALYF